MSRGVLRAYEDLVSRILGMVRNVQMLQRVNQHLIGTVRMHLWMDGWMEGRMYGWMDRQMDNHRW